MLEKRTLLTGSPSLVSAQFLHDALPQQLVFTFDQDVTKRGTFLSRGLLGAGFGDGLSAAPLVPITQVNVTTQWQMHGATDALRLHLHNAPWFDPPMPAAMSVGSDINHDAIVWFLWFDATDPLRGALD
jgi:hypothetical protein